MNQVLAVFLEIPIPNERDYAYAQDVVAMRYPALVDFWVNGLRNNSLQLDPLKPDTVQRKMAMHDLNPKAPLFASGKLLDRLKNSHPDFHFSENGGELVMQVAIGKDTRDQNHHAASVDTDMFFGNEEKGIPGRSLPVPPEWLHALWDALDPEESKPLFTGEPFPTWEEPLWD